MTLAAALAAGDAAAWGIIESHANRLGGVAAGHGADPEDALQDMRLKVWRAAASGRATFPTPGALVGYASSAMRTVAIDAHRAAAASMRAGVTVSFAEADRARHATPPADAHAQRADWRRRFWDALRPALPTARARVAIGSIAVDVPPRLVAAWWPHLFVDETDVYNERRNAMGRIRRSPAIVAALRELREGA